MSTSVPVPMALKTKFSCGLGALGKDLAGTIVYLCLMHYYTDVADVPAAFLAHR